MISATIRTFLIVAALMLATSNADAATRVYLMRGLGGLLLSSSMDVVASRLNTVKGVTATAGHWESWQYYADDALQNHRHDKVVFSGHSMGAAAAVWAANYLKSKGMNVRVVGLDPLCTFPRISKGIDNTNFYANWCQGQPGIVVGGNNVRLVGHGGGLFDHITIGSNIDVQNKMIAAILK